MSNTKQRASFDLDRIGRIAVSGRVAQTLIMLVSRADKGIVAFDFPGGPAFRLAAYIHSLRKLGLIIETRREPHDGGSHGRYVLLSRLHSVMTETKGAQG